MHIDRHVCDGQKDKSILTEPLNISRTEIVIYYISMADGIEATMTIFYLVITNSSKSVEVSHSLPQFGIK